MALFLKSSGIQILFLAAALFIPFKASAGLVDAFLCSSDITKEIHGHYTAVGNYDVGFIDIEITNNTKDLKITSVSMRFEGSYNGRSFKRVLEDNSVEVLPGVGARLLINTGIEYSAKVKIDYMKISKIYGCSY